MARTKKVTEAWNCQIRFEDALKAAAEDLTFSDLDAFQRLTDGLFRGLRAKIEALKAEE